MCGCGAAAIVAPSPLLGDSVGTDKFYCSCSPSFSPFLIEARRDVLRVAGSCRSSQSCCRFPVARISFILSHKTIQVICLNRPHNNVNNQILKIDFTVVPVKHA